MDYGPVAYGYPFAHANRVSEIGVKHGAILNVGIVEDLYAVLISPQDGAGPNADVIP